eukprot:g3197.t1
MAVIVVSGSSSVVAFKKLLKCSADPTPPLAFLPASGWDYPQHWMGPASMDKLERRPAAGFLGYAIDLIELPGPLEGLRRTVLWRIFRDLAVFETKEAAERQAFYTYWVALDSYTHANDVTGSSSGGGGGGGGQSLTADERIDLEHGLQEKKRRLGCSKCPRPSGATHEELVALAMERVSRARCCMEVLKKRLLQEKKRRLGCSKCLRPSGATHEELVALAMERGLARKLTLHH